ncbi:MAG: hypothetical protein JXJ04_26990 [Spirochaetales bacterium]|nr:hypothetical protein [Spirochaetales bacterium]
MSRVGTNPRIPTLLNLNTMSSPFWTSWSGPCQATTSKSKDIWFVGHSHGNGDVLLILPRKIAFNCRTNFSSEDYCINPYVERQVIQGVLDYYFSNE